MYKQKKKLKHVYNMIILSSENHTLHCINGRPLRQYQIFFSEIKWRHHKAQMGIMSLNKCHKFHRREGCDISLATNRYFGQHFSWSNWLYIIAYCVEEWASSFGDKFDCVHWDFVIGSSRHLTSECWILSYFKCCKSGNIWSALIFVNFAQFQQAWIQTPQKYLQYIV